MTPREGEPHWTSKGHRVLLSFSAEDLRGIGYALSYDDIGGKEMLQLADELDRLDGIELD